MATSSENVLCLIAPVQPPDGTTSNLVDPPSLENTAIAICTVMTVWATIFVAGRLYVNYKKLVLADYLAFAAFVFDVGYAAVMILSRHMFRHMWDIPVCWFTPQYMKINFANSMIAPVAICLSKTTILAMLYQIFRIRKEMRIAIWIGIIANILVYFPNLIIAPILGAPRIGETWDDLVVNQRPADQKWIGTYQGPLAVLLDVYIFVLPFPALNTLHMPSKKRLKLFILFGTALLGIVSSVVACVYRYRLIFAPMSDATWADAQIYLPIVVENYVALIVGCMPAFARFLRTHVADSTIYKMLRTRLISNSSRVTNSNSGRREGIETIGGGGGKKGEILEVHQRLANPADGFTEWNGYHELREANVFPQTQAHVASATAPSSGVQGYQGPGIARTIDVNQGYSEPQWSNYSGHHGPVITQPVDVHHGYNDPQWANYSGHQGPVITQATDVNQGYNEPPPAWSNYSRQV